MKQIKLIEFNSYKSVGFLNVDIENIPLNYMLVAKAMRVHQHNSCKLRYSHYKTISALQGSNHKVRPQKGTGRARQGANRELQRRGGAVKFGYSGDKNKDLTRRYRKTLKLNSKENKASRVQIIINRINLNHIIVVDKFEKLFEKTAEAKKYLQLNLNYAENTKIAMIPKADNSDNLLAFKNINNIKILNSESLGFLQMISCTKIIIELDAFASLLSNLGISHWIKACNTIW